MAIAVAAVGLLAGLWLRPRIGPRYSSFFRTQIVVIVLPLSALGGWSLQPTVQTAAALLLVLAGEMLGVAIARSRARHGHHPRFFAAAAGINSSYWALPAALALFGPAAATFTVLFDSLLAPLRNSLFVWMLRSSAPADQYSRTALVDYSRTLAAAVGLTLLAVLGHPAAWADSAIEVLGYVAAITGFALLGLALPRQIPRQSWREALSVVPLRFIPTTAVLGLAALAGLSLPSGAWVLALAPCWFAYLGWARLYGHQGEFAAAVILISLPLAAALLPVVALLGG